MARKKLPLTVNILPKHLVSGVTAKVNPRDFTGVGAQYHELALMPYLNTAVNDLRRVWDMTKLLRHLCRIEGPISTAVFNLVQVADCEYTVMAKNSQTNHYDPAGTDLIAGILAKMDNVPAGSGYSDVMAFSSLRQMMLRETILTNAVAVEMVLDKSLMFQKMVVIPFESLYWIKNEDGTYFPAQRINGQPNYTSLDIPTFFVQRAAGDPTDIMARSILEAAIKMLIYFEEVLEDIRKTMKQTGYARNVITLDLEKIRAAAPKDVLADVTKFAAFCEEVRTTVEASIKSVNPDDALVMWNTSTFEIVSPSFGKQTDYTPLMNQISGMYATSMKTPPSVLGMRMDSGSQALGNVETLIFLKAARAMQIPAEVVLSRILTLAARLTGEDIYVEFRFDTIDIRPKTELAAFKTMDQTRILELLSLGFITDDQAAAWFKTGRRPPGAPILSGTMFQTKPGVIDTPADAATNDAPAGGKSNAPKLGDTPIGKTMQPDKKIPRKAGGKSQ